MTYKDAYTDAVENRNWAGVAAECMAVMVHDGLFVGDEHTMIKTTQLIAYSIKIAYEYGGEDALQEAIALVTADKKIGDALPNSGSLSLN